MPRLKTVFKNAGLPNTVAEHLATLVRARVGDEVDVRYVRVEGSPARIASYDTPNTGMLLKHVIEAFSRLAYDFCDYEVTVFRLDGWDVTMVRTWDVDGNDAIVVFASNPESDKGVMLYIEPQ